MKRFIVCIMVFLMMLWFSGNSVHAKTPNRLQVISAAAYISDPENPTIEIYALNFGDNPQVKLGDNLLEGITFADQTISANLPEGILPGTYRLSVARKGFDFSHPEKADSLDVTISAGESSDTLNSINIYEITKTFGPKREDSSIISGTCECDNENDIALNGGFKVVRGPGNGDSYPELTIMESKIHRENNKDSYQVRVKNHSEADISIEANVICLSIP